MKITTALKLALVPALFVAVTFGIFLTESKSEDDSGLEKKSSVTQITTTPADENNWLTVTQVLLDSYVQANGKNYPVTQWTIANSSSYRAEVISATPEGIVRPGSFIDEMLDCGDQKIPGYAQGQAAGAGAHYASVTVRFVERLDESGNLVYLNDGREYTYTS